MPPKRKRPTDGSDGTAATSGRNGEQKKEEETPFDVPGLVRFLVAAAKIPLARAMPIAAGLARRDLTTPSAIRSASDLGALVANEADRKALARACRPGAGTKRTRATAASSVASPGASTVAFAVERPAEVDGRRVVRVNRAPYLVLFTHRLLAHLTELDDASTLSVAQAVASESAARKARSLQLADRSSTPAGVGTLLGTAGRTRTVDVMGRRVPVMFAPDGRSCKAFDLAALATPGGEGEGVAGLPTHGAEATWRYVVRSFDRAGLGHVVAALDAVFASHLAGAGDDGARQEARRALDAAAWMMYIRTRPDVASGVAGWGQKGDLSIEKILRCKAGVDPDVKREPEAQPSEALDHEAKPGLEPAVKVEEV